jgi:hypothetical protein
MHYALRKGGIDSSIIVMSDRPHAIVVCNGVNYDPTNPDITWHNVNIYHI